MKIKPLFDKVVLILQKNNKQSSIILPKESEEKPIIAEVVAVGEGGKVDGQTVVMKVKVGDKVLFNSYAGSEFNLDGISYILIKQTDILATIE